MLDALCRMPHLKYQSPLQVSTHLGYKVLKVLGNIFYEKHFRYIESCFSVLKSVLLHTSTTDLFKVPAD